MADYATRRSVDRIFLQAYVPKLQSVGGVYGPAEASGPVLSNAPDPGLPITAFVFIPMLRAVLGFHRSP
jgi:hypothetical protein